MALDYAGVFPAPPTPVDEDGKVIEAALRAMLEDNIAHGVHGFWMAGTTGEGPVLDDEARAAVARISAETCRGRALVIMHVGAMTTASAVRAARQARSAGCDAVCCLPPIFYPSNDRSRIAHYQAVTEAAGDLPFFVYNLPQLTQVETVPAMMEKFARALPTLKGLKHSAYNIGDIRKFTDMGLACFSGNGAYALPALAMGAVGTIDAPLALAPWLYVELDRAWRSGELERAKQAQAAVQAVVDLVWMFGAPTDVCKIVLARRLGLDFGRAIPPVASLTAPECEAVLQAAERVGVTVDPRGRSAATGAGKG